MIPDSWERTAGVVHNMDEYRRPGPDRPEGESGKVYDYARGKKIIRQRPPRENPTPYHPAGTDFPPYVEEPEREFYNSDDLDALHDSGFEPQGAGVWTRPLAGGTADQSHHIFYAPGRKDAGGKRIPWHATTDPQAEGRDFESLRGSRGALGNLPKHSSVFPHWTDFIDGA